MPFGVDEAGKGPVFGSMFAAAVRVGDESALPEAIDDSKRLSPEERETIAADLEADDRVRIGVAEVPVARIDDPATDMNGLTVDAHARAIDAVAADRPDADRRDDADEPLEGLCDACDTDAERFARRVRETCDAGCRVDGRHGADEDSPLVGAASVIAKVERDAHVAAIAAEYGEVGSGYPSDPATRAFLESYVDERGELPPFARASWSTCEEVLAAASQTGLDQF